MDLTTNRNNAPGSAPTPGAPVRPRGAGLVEEARILRAGGHISRISPLFQALVYLMLVGALALLLWSLWCP
jgi:hypothetical protein